ncbi:MAG: PH domain-containing protein, partial [Muribaculaceae bacterium]|nr:PH domain-containing protein [Muribaculaceae bacterium]
MLTTSFICGMFICSLKIEDNDIAVWLWGVAVMVLFLSALCYMPLSISLDNESLNISRSLKIKSIPLTEIADVRLCTPTMGAQ